MKTWQKILIPTLISLLVCGGYLLYVYKQRQNPGVIGPGEPAPATNPDDVAVVRLEFPQHFDDLNVLENKRVWMKNGYSMPYYPYVSGQVQFAKPAGLLPAAQPLDVKKITKQAVSAKVDDGLEHGSKQAMVVFAIPGKDGLFATAVGSMQGNHEAYFIDNLFYYDDPHKIYDNWPKDVWAAIDAHQVKPGMSELQTQMSIGMKAQPDGKEEGNRTVTYDQDGKHWTVTYANRRATEIKSE